MPLYFLKAYICINIYIYSYSFKNPTFINANMHDALTTFSHVNYKYFKIKMIYDSNARKWK